MVTAEEAIARLESQIGEDFGVSDWIEMTQEKFDRFAEITGDADWLHNDPERCKKESPFDGKTIAQGHLLLSNLTQVAESQMPQHDEVVFGLNYGYDRVRIIRPVTVGSRIRGKLSIKEITPKGDKRVVVKCDASIYTEGEEKPALVAEWLFLVQLA